MGITWQKFLNSSIDDIEITSYNPLFSLNKHVIVISTRDP